LDFATRPNKYNVKIHFAHRTFRWSSQARGKAAVHCVIIGFGLEGPQNPELYDYLTPESPAHKESVKRINPYLVDAPDVLLFNRNKPLGDVPSIKIGNKPIDDGNYLFYQKEMEDFVKKEPAASKWMRPWLGAEEFINRIPKFVLWLGDCPPEELRQMPLVMQRVEAVKAYRSSRDSIPTVKLAATPTRFHVENIPNSDVILIPRHSSISRQYIPMGFVTKDFLIGDSCLVAINATPYHFGIMESGMHMAWVRYVCGRLKSDYRYSAGVVYNNFPWPSPTEKQKSAIERAAQGVLDARALYPKSSLADLYDPLTMPKELVKAHQDLDAEVEKAYGKRFSSDADRVAFLFGEYQRLTSSNP